MPALKSLRNLGERARQNTDPFDALRRASVLSWQAEHAVVIGEITAVVPAAAVLVPVAAEKLKPAP